MSEQKTFDVLNIDAWRYDDSWTWNGSHVCGEITLDPGAEDEVIIRAFIDAGFIKDVPDLVYVDNDGADPTTISICSKEDDEPLFAIRVEW